jgi:phosphatidylserine decarboxylase
MQMANGSPANPPPPLGPETPVLAIQPGGGNCMRVELAWGRWRRWFLRTFRPGYVEAMRTKRQGACETCPGRLLGCRHEVIDARDLKYFRNVCGYHFAPADDRFVHRARLGFARPGLGEVVLTSLVCSFLLTLLITVMVLVNGVTAWVAGLFAVAVGAFWLEVLWFFRDPERNIPETPGALVSPADGRVTDVGEVDTPDFPGGRAYRIGIFLSVFNVHVNRSPRAARVTRLRYFPGRFLNALKPVSAVQNEQLWIDLEDAELGCPVQVKQIAGALARRIVCHLRPGDSLAAGERIGMIKIGSRTEVLVPVQTPFQVTVKVGQKVKGGESVLLVFPYDAAARPSGRFYTPSAPSSA